MTQNLVKKLLNFLKNHCDPSKPVLLALSGGSDSLALLYLTLECLQKMPFQLAIAHVDHGWRPESQVEASQLKSMVEQLSLPFHLCVLNPHKLKGNKEMIARQERLRFFYELSSTYHYQSVLLAHHRDDQSETILKRILEGTNISHGWGMTPITQLSEPHLTLWRPLLNIPKIDLTRFIEKLDKQFIIDKTNFDPKFLRARMRSDILPQLRRSFGKEIESNLSWLGNESQEIHAYLTEKLNHFISAIETATFGSFLDLSTYCPTSALELRFIIRHLCMQQNCSLNREIVESASTHTLSGASNKTFFIGKCCLIVDRKRLFIMQQSFPKISNANIKVCEAETFGPWKITIEKGKNLIPSERCSNWQSVWKGTVEVVLPEDAYEFGMPTMNTHYPRTSPIAKWWNTHKIPAFLRSKIPVIWRGDKIAHEFLTGKLCEEKTDPGKNMIKIKLDRQEKGQND